MLEGIGLIEKYSKNKIRWNGNMRLDNFGIEQNQEETEEAEREKERDQEKEIERLNEELRDIQREEGWLDGMISTVNHQLQEMANDELYEQFAYVTYDDIKKISNLSEDKDWTLLAIRAPSGTKLEIPDLDEKDKKDSKSKEEVKEHQSENSSNSPDVRASKTLNRNPKERGIQTGDNKRYQIMLNSGGEEIMVYLISNNDDKSEEDQGNDWDPDAEGEDQDDKDSFNNFDSQIQNDENNFESEKDQEKEDDDGSNVGNQNKEAVDSFAQSDGIENIFSVSNMFNN